MKIFNFWALGQRVKIFNFRASLQKMWRGGSLYLYTFKLQQETLMQLGKQGMGRKQPETSGNIKSKVIRAILRVKMDSKGFNRSQRTLKFSNHLLHPFSIRSLFPIL